MSSTDVYFVRDENGGGHFLHYTEGGSLYEEAKKDRESGATSQVYKSGRPDEEIYTPTSEAKATTTIDPMTGTITVDGPSWLTSEIVNSDSFKKNYSENKALLGLVNMYRNDTDSTIIDQTTGNPIKVADAINTYMDSANAYSGAFAAIKNYKDDVANKYGTSLTDQDVYIANNFHNKADYDKNGVVYVPEWAMNKYDWSSLESWDGEHKTISAQDFFENVFTEDFDDHTSSELQKWSRQMMEGFVYNNALETDNDEDERTKQDMLGDESYAEELARTIQMAELVAQNKPEIGAAYDAVMFTGGVLRTWAEDAGNAVSSVSAGMMQATESVTRIIPTEIDDFIASPLYISAGIVGEMINMLRSGPHGEGQINSWLNGLKEDVNAIFDSDTSTNAGDLINARRDELNKAFEDYSAEAQAVTGAWAAGEMFGHLAWKITENVILVDKVGRGVGAAIAHLGSASGVATVMSKVLSAKSVGKIFGVLGGAANFFAQGTLETYLDNKDLFDKALASGNLFDTDLWGKIAENTAWNGLAEGATSMAGMFAKTKAGQASALMLNKPISWTGGKINRGKVALSMWFHRWTPEQFAQMVESGAEGAAKTFGAEAMNTVATKFIADMQETASQIKVFGKTGEEIAESINEGYRNLQLTPATEVAKRGGAETVADASAASTAAAKEASNIEANYELLQRYKVIRANFENQIDNLTKGVSVMQTKMEQSTGEALPEFQAAANKVTELEGQLKARGKLTFFDTGTFLSKESSQYLSWSSQIGQYRWRAAAELGADASKEAIAAQRAAKEFLPKIEQRLEELRGILGDDLANALDDMLPKMGEYHKRLLDFMINGNYLGDEEVAKVMLARSQGWGPGGINYIPTSRLTDEDAMLYGFSTAGAKTTNKAEADAFFNRKTLSDGLYNLKPGNIDQEFGDPIMTLFTKTRTMATIAQAQDITRSVRAASILSRGVSKFTDSGITQYEKNFVEKGFNGLKKSFDDSFKGAKGAFAESVRDEFTKSGIFESAFKQQSYVSGYNAASDNLQKTGTALDKITKPTKTYANDFRKGANNAEMEQILNFLPEEVEVPSFDIRSLRANSFDDWFNSLPEKSRKFIDRELKRQGYARNVTNVKKIASATDNFQLNLKKQFANEHLEDLGKSSDYWDFIKAKKITKLEAENNSTLLTARENYEKALSRFKEISKDGEKPVAFSADKIETLGKDFSLHIDNIFEKLLDDLSGKLRSNPAFSKMAKQLAEDASGAFSSVEDAERYIVLNQLDKMKAKDFAAPILDTMGGKSKSAAQLMAEKLRGASGDAAFTKLSKSFGDGVKEKVTTELNTTLNALKLSGAEESIDLDSYWKRVRDYISDIEEKGLMRKVKKDGSVFVDFDRAKLVQMVDTDGTVKFYEVDPMAAIMINKSANFRYTPSKNAIIDTISNATARFSQVFRWGTTGIDIPSYINQWSRDSMDATIVGFGRPLTDLDFGSVKSVGASLVWDSIPGARLTKFGQKVLGDAMTARVSDKVVEATFDTTRDGLIAQFGKEWWDNFAAAATKDLTGEAADVALKRATVEFSADTMGAGALPNMGAMTEAQFYRASTGSTAAAKDVRKEQLAAIYGNGMTKEEANTFRKTTSKMWDGFDNFIEKTSRGDFREQMYRRSVYTTQYRVAIESGMTMQEAKIWATRYALDATTDFNRTFMFANQFIHSVPYLGAAINGQKSFLRLLELDPVGVMSRFTNNLIIPYSALLAKSLSDPDNREVYKTIREYEKADSMILVYKGEKIQIPLPQQLSKFLAPFRHAIEDAAGVQDASWWNLAASDILGIFPIDLSGFIDLDGNTILEGDEETGLSAHISRGVEKAASSLMPPTVKSIYMWKTGRDPYTGRDIDTSYITQDEDGNEIIIDDTQSAIARWLSGFDPELSASAAKKILQGLLGRSTLTVLDGAVEVLSGNFDLRAGIDELASQISAPVDGGSNYNQARSDWNSAISLAWKKREEMLADDSFQKSLSTIRNSNSSETQVENAKRNYKQKMDEYSSFVLDIAKAMKQKYPDQYTRTRAAQIVSLLTLPTGYSPNNTAYAAELQSEEYFGSRAEAISTYLKLGFKEDYAGTSVLGTGYYDKTSGEYKFKEFTPYEIELMNSNKYNTTDQIQAMIRKALKDADITTSKMWEAYYSANTKADRKQVSDEWNTMVVKALYPLVSKYSVGTVLGDSATRDLLEDYLLISNPYKKKQYMYQIFGGEQ